MAWYEGGGQPSEGIPEDVGHAAEEDDGADEDRPDDGTPDGAFRPGGLDGTVARGAGAQEAIELSAVFGAERFLLHVGSFRLAGDHVRLHFIASQRRRILVDDVCH